MQFAGRTFAAAVTVTMCISVGAAPGQDVGAADQKFRSAMEKAAKSHQEAVVAARAEYITALKELLGEETKKGNLDGALAIREKVKRMETQGGESQSILKRLASTNWVNANGVAFQWKEDGTLYHSGKERPCFPLDAQRVAVVFDNSHIDILLFDEKFSKFEQYSTRGSDKPLFTGKRATLR